MVSTTPVLEKTVSYPDQDTITEQAIKAVAWMEHVCHQIQERIKVQGETKSMWSTYHASCAAAIQDSLQIIEGILPFLQESTSNHRMAK